MENPRRKKATMECRIERDPRTAGRSFVVTADGAALDVTVVAYTRQPQSTLKDWLHHVRRIYTAKKLRNRKIPVGISAINRHNALGSPGVRKDSHYEMFQICLGQHCLLIEIEPYCVACWGLKDFFREFFWDDSFLFVGVGIKDVVAKISDDYKDTDFKGLTEIPNPVDLRELAAREPRFGFLKGGKCGLEMLVKLVLGVEYEKPKRIVWYGCGDRAYEFSDELILWSSVDVYLMAKMGMKLLSESGSLATGNKDW